MTTYRWSAGDFEPVAERRFGSPVGSGIVERPATSGAAGVERTMVAAGEQEGDG